MDDVSGSAELIGEREAPTRQALRVMKEQNLSHVAHYNNWVSAVDRPISNRRTGPAIQETVLEGLPDLQELVEDAPGGAPDDVIVDGEVVDGEVHLVGDPVLGPVDGRIQ